MDATAGATAATYELEDGDLWFWRETFCDELLDADAPVSSLSRLDATLRVAVAGGAVALDAEVRCAGLAIARGPQRVGRDRRVEAIGVTLVESGSALVQTPGGEHVIGPGDVSLLHSGQPFTKRLSADYRERFLYLPRPVVRSLMGRDVPDPRAIVAPRRGLSRLLAHGLASFAREREQLAPSEWTPSIRALLELTSAVFAPPPADRDERRALPAARAAQRDRVLRFIDTHLGDPDLAPPRIAAALGMSLRYLHQIFQDSGATVGATILARRLDRCHALLRDPAFRRRSVSEIAFACGFNDAAHFSRTFKARFGFPPRDLRRETTTDIDPV